MKEKTTRHISPHPLSIFVSPFIVLSLPRTKLKSKKKEKGQNKKMALSVSFICFSPNKRGWFLVQRVSKDTVGAFPLFFYYHLAQCSLKLDAQNSAQLKTYWEDKNAKGKNSLSRLRLTWAETEIHLSGLAIRFSSAKLPFPILICSVQTDCYNNS